MNQIAKPKARLPIPLIIAYLLLALPTLAQEQGPNKEPSDSTPLQKASPPIAPLAVPVKTVFSKEIYQDFRGRKDLVQELKLVGKESDRFCSVEEGGLRIQLPAQRVDKQPVGVRVRAQVPIHGDFEITGTYEFLSSMPANDGWPVGIALNLSVKNDFRTFAKVGRFLLAGGGHVFAVESWDKEQPKPYVSLNRPATSGAGMVRLVREGSMLSYQAADGPFSDFREYYRREFSADDVGMVRFAVSGHPVRVDARLIELKIRYGGASERAVAETPAPAAAADVAAPMPAPRLWADLPTGRDRALVPFFE